VLFVLLGCTAPAAAIDLYEIQIYSGETTPPQHLTLELHSNAVVTATGRRATQELRPEELHETFEVTYGLLPHVEIGQYFCTARFLNGSYDYAGSRTKLHFGLGDARSWPVALGGNIELAYMRRQAEENPLSLELRPILETRWGKWWLVGDFALEKPLSGPGSHTGWALSPSGLLSYELLPWLTPALEYYGDLGALRHFPACQHQQHFLVPTLILDLLPPLEINFGVGVGLTQASSGIFLKSIIGWTF
jgi:hypothetical protein